MIIHGIPFTVPGFYICTVLEITLPSYLLVIRQLTWLSSHAWCVVHPLIHLLAC